MPAERRAMFMILLLGALASQHDNHGLQQDPEIQQQAPVFDVFAVQADNFVKVSDLVPTADLPHAGDAGLHAGADAVLKAIVFPLVHSGGAPAHQTEIADEAVKKLGELIQRGSADEAADAGENARVVIHLEHQALHFIALHQFRFALFGVQVHAAELVDLKALAVLADALLGEDDGAGIGTVDRRGHEKKDDARQDAAHQAAKNIEKALDGKRTGTGKAVADGKHLVAPHLAQVGIGPAVNGLGGVVDGDAHGHQVFHELHGGQHIVRLEEKNLVHPIVAEFANGLLIQEGDRRIVFPLLIGLELIFLIAADGESGGETFRNLLIQQDDAGNVKITVCVVAEEILQHRLRQTGRGHHHQGIGPAAADDTPPDIALPDHAAGPVPQIVEDNRPAGLQAGDDISLLGDEEDQCHQRQQRHSEAGNGIKLLILASPEDATVVGGEEDDYQLADQEECIQQTEGRRLKRAAPPVNHPKSQQKCSLQCKHIQEDKIPMFGKAFYMLLVQRKSHPC